MEKCFSRKVFIIEVSRREWLKTNSIQGWSNILNKVQESVQIAIKEDDSKKVDLIGHSSGGIILRLYLTNELFNNKTYDGKLFTKQLITLGSPHQALRATTLRKYVDENYPGKFFKNINYISVGGTVDINSKEASLFTKIFAKNSYKSISGKKNELGDGLVPLSSSILKGSQEIIIPSTFHSRIFGDNWYGSPKIIKEWYDKINWE